MFLRMKGELSIEVGGLEGLREIALQTHIFTSNKTSWFEIGDDLPQLEGRPEPESKVREASSK